MILLLIGQHSLSDGQAMSCIEEGLNTPNFKQYFFLLFLHEPSSSPEGSLLFQTTLLALRKTGWCGFWIHLASLAGKSAVFFVTVAEVSISYSLC
jgi:hypothetical protein